MKNSVYRKDASFPHLTGANRVLTTLPSCLDALFFMKVPHIPKKVFLSLEYDSLVTYGLKQGVSLWSEGTDQV